MAALLGCAFVLVVFVGIMLFLGTSLFLGEWLFGSMGWGVVHSILAFTALAITAVMVGLAFSPVRLFLWFLLAFVIGIVAALVFGFDVFNQIYKAIGDAILPGVSESDRPLVTGVLLVGLIGLVIALIAFLRLAGTQAFRERPGSAVIQLVLALLVGFLYGAFIGAVTAITFAWRPAFGLGLAIAYALWSVFLLIDLARTGIDQEALKERFYPSRTIDTTKETLEWLQKRMPRENES
jgi:MFS family permease